LEREPDWNQLPPATPAALRKLLKRCLTKDPRERLQAIGEARVQLAMIADPAAQADNAEIATYPRWKKLLPWAAAPLLLAAGYFLRPSPVPPNREISQFEFQLPANHLLLHNYRRGLDMSS